MTFHGVSIHRLLDTSSAERNSARASKAEQDFPVERKPEATCSTGAATSRITDCGRLVRITIKDYDYRRLDCPADLRSPPAHCLGCRADLHNPAGRGRH